MPPRVWAWNAVSGWPPRCCSAATSASSTTRHAVGWSAARSAYNTSHGRRHATLVCGCSRFRTWNPPKGENGASQESRQRRHSEVASEKPCPETRDDELEQGDPRRRLRGRSQQQRDEVGRPEQRRLRIAHQRRPAEVRVLPQRQAAGPCKHVRCVLLPRLELLHRVAQDRRIRRRRRTHLGRERAVGDEGRTGRKQLSPQGRGPKNHGGQSQECR